MIGNGLQCQGRVAIRYLGRLVVALSLCGAYETASANPLPFDVAVGTAPATLLDFGRQAGLQLLFDFESVKQVETRAVAGQLEPAVALTEMLRGTGLTFSMVNDRTVAVKSNRLAASHLSANGAGPLAVAASVESSATEESGPKSTKLPATKDSAQGDLLQEVLVTASSRIKRAAEDIPAPINVVNSAAISRTGFDNLSDIMTRTSQFGVGLGNNPGGGGANSSDAGATFLNLRGMGINRTLVLIDGLRRVSGTASSSAVDLATIPAAMIDHVEVTTGGAAAIYGADAVTGVVNVVLKHPTDGIDIAVRGGISAQGDAARPGINAVFGQKTDRSEFSLGLSYSYEPLLHAQDRSFSRQHLSEFSNPQVSAANPYTNLLFENWRFPNTSYGSAFVIGGTRYTVDASGAVRPTQNNGGTPYGPLGFLAVDGDGFNQADFDVLRLKSKIFSALSRFSYRMTDSLTFTTDVQFGHSATDIPLQPNYEFWTIQRSNPFVPAAVGALMDQNGLTELSYGRTDVDQGISHNLGDRSTYTIVTKIDGEAGSRFKWDVSYQYGYFQGKSTLTVNRITSRYREALDAVAGPNGPECASATAVAAGCRPINIFGPNAATADAIAYFRDDAVTDIANSQQVMGAHLNGSLFDLPAGPVMIATGVEYRTESQDIHTDPFGTARLLQVNNGPSSYTSFNVKEAFAEAVVPLATNQRFAKTLELEAAARYSDYDTIGTTNAWKVGGVWAPSDSIRFRFTRSSDVRAPNLTELFSPGINGLTNPTDPCSAVNINSGSATRAANCAALGIPVGYLDSLPGAGKVLTTRGNSTLTPESSTDWTFGIVVTPSLLPRFRFSADWWSIDINRAVSTLTAQRIVNGCVDGPTLNPLLCPLVLRGGTVGGIPVSNLQLSGVVVQPVNAAKQKAEGVDFSTQYSLDLPTHVLSSRNSLSFSLGGTYYMKNTTYLPGSAPILSAGSSALPKVRANLVTEFTAGRLALNWNTRYISSSKEDVNYAPLFVNDNHVASRLYNDLAGTFDIREAIRLQVGVSNVFDVSPPRTAFTFEGIGAGGLFDNIGRYFFVELRARL